MEIIKLLLNQQGKKKEKKLFMKYSHFIQDSTIWLDKLLCLKQFKKRRNI